jgi:hypothetical protein
MAEGFEGELFFHGRDRDGDGHEGGGFAGFVAGCGAGEASSTLAKPWAVLK